MNNTYTKEQAISIAACLGYSVLKREDVKHYMSFSSCQRSEYLNFNLRTGKVWLDLCFGGISLSSRSVYCDNENEFILLQEKYKKYADACLLANS
jgi:hypothetical protein